MILECEVDRRQISQGLVWPSEVVFNEPFGKTAVEFLGIGSHVSEAQKLILERAVELSLTRIAAPPELP